MKEIATTGTPDSLKAYCRGSYTSDFAVFASVKRLDGATKNTARVSYFLAFGDEKAIASYSSLPSEVQSIVKLLGLQGHDQDVENEIVDIVNGTFTSMRFNVHTGAYSRPRSLLETTTDNAHANVYLGKYFHASYHTTDRYDISNSKSATAIALNAVGLGYIPNLSDYRGSDHVGFGKLIMIDEVCAASGDSYVSPDKVTYTGAHLTGLKALIGCTGATGMWTNNITKKEMYTKPYSLVGCEAGNTSGGDSICWPSAFGTDSWDTSTWSNSSSTRTLFYGAVGEADVDEARGSFFSDFDVSTKPSAIELKSGERIDGITMKYDGNITRKHGSSGGSSLSYYDSKGKWDPVVKFTLCPASKSHKWRAGRAEFTTRSGRTLKGGKSEASSSHKCVTQSLTGTNVLRGFYGRSGGEVDLLGAFTGPE